MQTRIPNFTAVTNSCPEPEPNALVSRPGTLLALGPSHARSTWLTFQKSIPEIPRGGLSVCPIGQSIEDAGMLPRKQEYWSLPQSCHACNGGRQYEARPTPRKSGDQTLRL